MSVSRAIQYPAQNGAYAVKVKNGAHWRAFDTARIHISVGQAYHEGDKFKATINWLKYRFDKVIICVNDTLQRHNHIFDGMDEQAAFALAKENGRQWINRNSDILKTLPDVKIHRWEYWRTLPEYKAELKKINSLYRCDDVVRHAIDDDVMTFWQRRQNKQGLTDMHRLAAFQAYSTRYLIEECAAFSLMFKQSRAMDIYPGSALLPCVLFKEEKPLRNKAFTRIDFLRNKPSPSLPLAGFAHG